jgi:hypothetical protein
LHLVRLLLEQSNEFIFVHLFTSHNQVKNKPYADLDNAEVNQLI